MRREKVIWWETFFFNEIKNEPHFRFIYKKVHLIPHQKFRNSQKTFLVITQMSISEYLRILEFRIFFFKSKISNP